MTATPNTPGGICFLQEELPNFQERIFIDVPKGSINIAQLELCMAFINQTNMPNLLMCINQLYFQAASDPFFDMNDDQKASLEAISKLLINFWISERKVTYD